MYYGFTTVNWKHIQRVLIFLFFSNRLPMPSDNLSHWSDVFMWRHHHYQAIVAAYENQAQHEPVSKNTVAYMFYQYVHTHIPTSL